MSDQRAFDARSVVDGAVLPAAARDLIIRSHGIPDGVSALAQDGWVAPSVPVLVRGALRILPLAWWGEPGVYNAYAQPADIASFAAHVQGAALHRAGPWSLLDLDRESVDSVGSYSAALREAGVAKAQGWAYSETEGVALVWAGDESAGTASLAVHVVPAGWVSERLAGAPVSGIDASWTWSDVIALRGE